ncbi:MAG: response regulator [Campylobacterota bacterium]|nr:response regulator [Campylobacterota bacterium]
MIARSLRILFIDDSSTIRDMVESALLELGFLNIQSAVDGIDALRVCDEAEEEFEFIITDINMPNMDGIELIHNLRNRMDYISIPIMVLSTEWSNEMKQKGKDAGATSWIVKPFDKELLNRAIEETVNKVENS